MSKLENYFVERTERSAIGELLSVTMADGIVKAKELDRTDNSSEDKSNYKVVHRDDIAYNSMRMWQGASGYSNYDGIVSPAYTVVTPKNEDVDVVFIHYLFKRNDMLFQFRINSQGLTSDTWNLRFSHFSQIRCHIPSKSEQETIAVMFKYLENYIANCKTKLAKLRNTKQSLLHKMFV